jgi:hypothetical protein
MPCTFAKQWLFGIVSSEPTPSLFGSYVAPRTRLAFLGRVLFPKPQRISQEVLLQPQSSRMVDLPHIHIEELSFDINPKHLGSELAIHIGQSVTCPPSFKDFRNVCSEVSSGLYVSGSQIAHDLKELRRRSITHIINTADCDCLFTDEVTYLALNINDRGTDDIECLLPLCIEFIDKALSGDGKVLVHCLEGVSRSCAVVIAYLMWRERLDYKEAQRHVQCIRPVCQPNVGFVCQLLDFQNRLESETTQIAIRFRVAVRISLGYTVYVGKRVDVSECMDQRFGYIEQRKESLTIIIESTSPNFDKLKEGAFGVIKNLSFLHRQSWPVEYAHMSECHLDPSLDDEFKLWNFS